MKINSIKFRNLLSFGKKYTEIDFSNPEVFLVTGINGTGKSTLFLESIHYNLTGKPFRKIKLAELINTTNKKEMLTYGVYESDNGKKVEIERGESPKVFNIWINGEKQDKDSSKDFQYIIESILNFDPKNLSKYILISTTSYKPFFNSTPQDKREIIDQIFGCSYFSLMADNIKKERTIQKENIKDSNYNIDKIKSNLEILDKIKKSSNEDELKIDKDISNFENKLIEKNKELSVIDCSNLKKEIEELIEKNKKQIKVIETIKISVSINESKFKTEYERLNTKLENIKSTDICPSCNQKVLNKQDLEWEVEKEILKLDEIKHKYETEDKKLKKYQKINEELQNNISLRDKELKEINNNINNLKTEIREIEYEINILKNKKLNSTQPFDEDKYKELTKELNSEYDNNAKLKEQLLVIETSLELLGDKYLRSYVNSLYLPLLNESLNKYLDIFGFPFKITLNENLEEIMHNKNYEKLSFDSLSVGEKQRLNLSLLFSFYDIQKSKKESSSLVVFDEILDGSLDIQAIESLNQIITQMKDEGKCCVLISHTDKTNIIKYDKLFNLKKKNKFSEIEII